MSRINNYMIEGINNLKSNDVITVVCSFCSMNYNRKVRDIRTSMRRRKDGTDKMYCSSTCSNRAKNRSVKTECKQCGCSVTLWLCQLNSKYRKSQNAFCSTKCAATFNNKQRYINHTPKIKIKKIKTKLYFDKRCLQCNIDFSTQRKHSSYCSGRCRNLNLKLHNFAHKSSGKSRSKIEEYIEQKLTSILRTRHTYTEIRFSI